MKYYNSSFSESYAKYYYANNKRLIEKHNELFKRGLKTYTLEINQFSDMRFIHFNALFPLATSSGVSHHKPAQPVQPAKESYDPKLDGLIIDVDDQGINCNSGWAYAAAKSIQIFSAFNGVPKLDPPSLSAQNFIDCAGSSIACKNQVPQAAFDYLTQYDTTRLYLQQSYQNKNHESQPGMCVPPNDMDPQISVKLMEYSRINDGDDATLAQYVSNFHPVVVEFNPTSFEFMHYAGGVFQQPTTNKGSHFMVVVGYGKEEIKPNVVMDYWLLQNSFGTTWGEHGLIKVHRSPHSKLAKNAIFPSMLL